MKYCTNCLLPSTKPQLTFNENGVCAACTSYWNRPEIDWGQRQKKFLNIVSEIKKKIIKKIIGIV